MRSCSIQKSAVTLCLLSILTVFVAPTSIAATISYSFDFSVPPAAEVGSGAGNELQYYDTETSTKLARVTSWYLGTAPDATIDEATGHFLSSGTNIGVGVCNPEEANCLTKENQRGITETAGTDWLLIMFDETMNISEFVITPDTGDKKPKAQWADVTFYTGFLDSSADLLGASYGDLTSSLGLTDFSVLNGAKTDTDVTVDVTTLAGGDIWGNAILIGPADNPLGGSDRFLLNNVSTVVPIPAAAWLLLSALSVLFGQKKLSDRKSD
ncbi:MAG: hypothetical protein P8Y61_10380 [Gammaproteobacteria bacterium]